MNEKLQNSLAEVVTFLLTWAKETKGFVAEQAPLIVREAITYGRAIETWQLVASLIFLVIGLVLLKRHLKKLLDLEEPNLEAILGIFFTVIGTVAVFINAPNFFMVWFAPRIYLLRWAAELLKEVK